MDHQISWRSRPPAAMQGNNICPICSISHFPFCPPHPPFHENPRFYQSHNHTNYHFPQFDHRPYPPAPVDNLYSVDGFGDRFPRHMSPNVPSHDHTSSVGVKRMRADENYSNFVSEDERRLKSLIRDHGNVSAGSVPSSNYENNGYIHEKSVLRNKFNEIDGGEHRIIDKVPLKSNGNGEMYEFLNPCVDYIEKGPSSRLEHGFNPQDSRKEKGFDFGQRYMHGVDNIDKGGIPYKSNFTNSSLSDPERVDMTRQSLDSQSMHYPFPGAPNESCPSNDIKRTNPAGSILMKEPHDSYPTNWHGVMQGSVNEQRSNFPLVNQKLDNQLPNYHARQSFGVNVRAENAFSSPSGAQNSNKGVYPPLYSRANAGAAPHVYDVIDVQPPLPASPPPPLPMESIGQPYPKPFDSSSSSIASSSLFPISVSSSMDVPLSYPSAAEAHSLVQMPHNDHPNRHTSRGVSEDFQSRQTSFKKYPGEQRTIPLRPIVSDKPKIIDGSQIFKQPHRATRPDHIVIILRGLPGSGKSYLAKILRDIEVENGGDAPRIHSMDDYFMTEVEKVVDTEFSKSSGSIRGRKPVTKKVMEYCYEPEMEEAYRSSMLKAFKKTLDEGVFSFIIVDDRNLRVADFAQFWATAKRSGFEVYLLEATYKDPAGCAARNVHGFSKDDIQNMAGQWEEASAMYLKLDIKSLLNGDDLEDSGIQEVDMDMEDDDPAGGLTRSEETNPHDPSAPLDKDVKSSGPAEDDKRWDKKDHPTDEVKELRRSKWSDDFDEGDAKRSVSLKSNSSSLSGLISAYSKQGKSVHWGDKVGNIGFSIGAANKANVVSLVIGPGAGYNLKSNPLTEPENLPSVRKNVESQRQNIFQEQLRAERESFKAIFEKRKQRISGLGTEEDRL